MLSIRYRHRQGNIWIVVEIVGAFRNCSECRDASEMLELTLICSGWFWNIRDVSECSRSLGIAEHISEMRCLESIRDCTEMRGLSPAISLLCTQTFPICSWITKNEIVYRLVRNKELIVLRPTWSLNNHIVVDICNIRSLYISLNFSAV